MRRPQTAVDISEEDCEGGQGCAEQFPGPHLVPLSNDRHGHGKQRRNIHHFCRSLWPCYPQDVKVEVPVLQKCSPQIPHPLRESQLPVKVLPCLWGLNCAQV